MYATTLRTQIITINYKLFYFNIMLSLYNKRVQVEIPSHRKQEILKRLYKALDDEARPFHMYVSMSHGGTTAIRVQATTKEDAAYFSHLVERCVEEG